MTIASGHSAAGYSVIAGSCDCLRQEHPHFKVLCSLLALSCLPAWQTAAASNSMADHRPSIQQEGVM